MSLEELLESTSNRLGLNPLSLNAAGVCRLVIDGGFGVTIEKSLIDQAAHFYTELMRLPDQDREPLFAQLLEAQLFGREVGDGIRFGLDLQTGEILLQRKLTLEGLSQDDFYAALTEFVNWAEHWQRKLGVLKTAIQPDPLSPEVMEPHLIRA